MATEKDESKKAKPAAKPAKAAAADAGAAKAAKPAKAAKAVTASSKATPAVTDGPACRAEGCKQPVRAKGYCRKHFVAWRRGLVGDHHRYKILREGRVPEAARQGWLLRGARRHQGA